MSTTKVYTLTAGQATDWMNLRPFSGGAVPFQGLCTGGGIASLQTANDDTTAKADTVTLESYSTASFARAMESPLPNYCRIKNTGTGTVVVTFGQGTAATGDRSQVVAAAFSAGGPSNEMP